MAAPRFLYPNLVRAGGLTVIGSSEEPGLPAMNVRKQLRSQVWRSKTGWTVVPGFNDEILFTTNDGVRLGHIAPGNYGTGAAQATAVAAAMNAAGYNPRSSFVGSLSGWWRADSVTLDGSGLVSQLNDLSGNARHLTQGTANLRPLWVANAIDSRPGLYFNNTASQAMLSSALMSAFLGANGVGTVVIIFRLDADASASDILFIAGSAGHFDALYWAGGTTFNADMFDSANRTAAKVAGAGVSQWHHGWWKYDQTNISCFIDDADTAAAANTAATGASHTDILNSVLTLGSNSSNPLKGYLVEAMIWNKSLSETERRGIVQYFEGRYPSIAAIDATTAVTWGVTLATSYDTATKKFTVSKSAGAGNISLEASTGVPTEDKTAACLKDLGFTIAADKTGATTYTAENAAYQSAHYLKVDLGAAAALTRAVALDHNAGASGGTFTQQGNSLDLFLSPALSQALAGDATVRLAYFGSSSQRYLRLLIEDQQNAIGYAELGVWDAGVYVTPSFPYTHNFNKVLEELSGISYGTHGSHQQDERPQRWVWNPDWEHMPDADRQLFELLATTIKAGATFCVGWDPVGTPTDFNYVFRRADTSYQMATAFPHWNIPFQLVEALD